MSTDRNRDFSREWKRLSEDIADATDSLRRVDMIVKGYLPGAHRINEASVEATVKRLADLVERQKALTAELAQAVEEATAVQRWNADDFPPTPTEQAVFMAAADGR